MTSEERVLGTSKATVVSPVNLRKLSFGKVGRKQSNGSVHRASSCSSNSGGSSRPEAETTGHHRQPAKSRIRQHRHRLSAVFSRSVSTLGRGDGMASASAGATGEESLVADDPSELSNHVTAPGILKIFGNEICEGANYKSVLATTHSSARELVKEALERYCLSKADADSYVLCDVIGCIGDHQWRTECLRVVGDNEKPLLLQSLWKPREGYARRFEIQKRASVEERTSKDKDTVTAGLNAQARKLQKTRSRGKSIFLDMMRRRSQTDGGQGLWRSRSEADIVAEEEDPEESPEGSPDAPSSPCGFQVGPPGEKTSGPSASRGAGGGGAGAVATEEEAYKAAQCPAHEREETESSDDNGTQYFIHPPFDLPYFLLLQGYSARQDFIIYPISGESTVFGHGVSVAVGEKESSSVDVSLWAPDIASQHCGIHRLQPDSSTPGEESDKGPCATSVKPFQGAVVKRNGVGVTQEVSLRNGDLLGLGEYYLFMFKDPTAAAEGLQPYCELISVQMPDSPLAEPLCNTCVSSRTNPSRRPRESADVLLLPCLKGSEGQELSLVYDAEHEENVLRDIFSAAVAGRDGEPKLTPALLLCLCLQRSATHFSTASLRKLLLRIASEVQTTVWQHAKELAAVQPEMASASSQDPEELQPLTIDKLVPGLQPLVLWMANSIELLHFIQQEVPRLLHGLTPEEEQDYREEEDEEAHIALLEMRLSAVRPASEEAMTVLEEVIMFTFQQCVYYLTKVLYPLLASVLDSHPFSETGQLLVPEDLSSLLAVLQRALQLVKDFQVHWEIGSQLLAYLFFFINAFLFNLLMERGSGGTFYQWSRGVQIRANLDLVMDWAQGVELGELALGCLSKLSAAVNLLATPKEHLLQDTWRSLRNEFAQLNPAQLHHLLREYSPGRAGPLAWTPCTTEAQAAFRTVDILESLDNHPPLVLPCSGFVLELRRPVRDAELTEQAARLQEVIDRLPPGGGAETNPGTTQDSVVPMEAKVTKMESLPMAQLEVGQVERVVPHHDGGDWSPGPVLSAEPGSRGAPTNEKSMSPEVQSAEPQNLSRRHHRHRSSRGLALDPAGPCSLTPPTTPQSLRLSEAETETVTETDHHEEENDLQRRNASRNHSSAGTHLKDTVKKMMAEEEEEEEEEDDEDEDEVFAVELRRGVCGLGLALVNGTETPLEVDGIYIRSILPGSPAAQSHSLCPGDRILAVNGINLVGMDYHGGRDLIRQSGEKARLLVARSTSWSGRSRVSQDCIS
ncbi:ras-associating and dilute domain-containing protein [Sardina pilchardus]|uniref:ras-associating and dilute domain-containing protein n=1 Tax=Sardina pilchardus TaxID=27697 RepID=UPI002E0FEF9C